MPLFRVNESRVTETMTIQVETAPPALPANPDAAALTLRPGVHRFQLVVEDEDGNRSRPAFVDVLVKPRQVIFDPTPGPFRPGRPN